jgi:hypothetical protein
MSVMTYASPTWEHGADAHLLKLLRLQNTALHASVNIYLHARASPRIACGIQSFLHVRLYK